MPGEFERLFAQQGAPNPQVNTTEPQGPRGMAGKGGDPTMAARVVIQKFVAMMTGEGWGPEKILEFIMGVLVAQAQEQGKQPPDENKVRQLIEEAATQIPGGGAQAAMGALPQAGPGGAVQ